MTIDSGTDGAAHRPSSRREVELAVRKIMETVLLLDPDIAAKAEFETLGTLVSLGVTSIDAFELIVSVEEHFGFEFDDRELSPELVEPLSKLVTAVCAKLNVPD